MSAPSSALIHDYWWQAILALPPERHSLGYDRLRHLWIDPTRTRTVGGRRVQEFYNPAWETHITAALWENFACLPVHAWLPPLLQESGLRAAVEGIPTANWSYGWVCEHPQRRIMDIVIHYRGARNHEGVIVVEAKSPSARLTPGKDTDPGYYLDVPELQAFPSRSQIYLLDEGALPGAKELVTSGSHDVGFLSWQRLAALQLAAVQSLEVPATVKAFIAAAIHRQYLAYGVTPPTPPVSYLASEPHRTDVDLVPGQQRQSNGDRQRARWRISHDAATA